MSAILVGGREWRGQLDFDADELRNIAYALGMHDKGAQEMFDLAEELDRLNGASES